MAMNTLRPINNLPTYLFNSSILFQERLKLQLLEEDDAHEEKAKHDVAKVAEDMVEVTDMAEGLPGTQGCHELTRGPAAPAEVVIVADVLVSCHSLLCRKPGLLGRLRLVEMMVGNLKTICRTGRE